MYVWKLTPNYKNCHGHNLEYHNQPDNRSEMNTDLVIALVFFIVIFCLLAAVNIWRSWNFLGPILCCHLFRPEAKQQFRSNKNQMDQVEYERRSKKQSNRMQQVQHGQQDPNLPPFNSQYGSHPNNQQQNTQPNQGAPNQGAPNQQQQGNSAPSQQSFQNPIQYGQQGQSVPPGQVPQNQPQNNPQQNIPPQYNPPPTPQFGLPTFPNYQQPGTQPNFQQARSCYAPHYVSYTTSNQPNDFRVFEEV